MPATRPDVLPPIQVGAWLRAGSVFQGSDPSKVNDWRMDNAYAELHAGGKIHKLVSVTLNLNANMTRLRTAVDLADRPGQPAGVDHGRDHLVRPDGRIPRVGRPPARPRRPRQRVRSVLHDPVELPRVHAVGGNRQIVAAPLEGAFGRNNGAVIWGDISGGKLTYLAGVFDNLAVPPRARCSRGACGWRCGIRSPGSGVTAATSATRTCCPSASAGSSRTTAHGPGQRTGPRSTSTCSSRRSSAAARSSPARPRTTTTHVNDGGVSDSLYALAAYATPPIGPGSIQPMVRYQWAKIKANTARQSLEHRRRTFLPDQGARRCGCSPRTATPRSPAT